MSYLKQFIIVSVMMLMLSISVMADEEAAVRTGLRPDAPQYAIRGSYAVGTRDLVSDGENPLDITIWYPALNEDNRDEVIDYPYDNSFDPMSEVTVTLAGHAIGDAAYDLSSAPYPTVVLSSGFLLGRSHYAWLAEHLASYGFVVIAPEHQEQFDETLSDFWKAAIDRPQDIAMLFDYIDQEVTADGMLAGLIDAETVAVIGHSYGGYTSLAMAGAQFDIDNFEALCDEAAATGDEASAWLCGLVLPYITDMAEYAGLDTVPEGLWESHGDDRIDAIIPMAGDAYLFGAAGLAAIDIPVMAMGGTIDTGTPYQWGTQMTYDHVSSATKVQVGLENAEHMVFGSTCDAFPYFAEIGFYAQCSDSVWDMDRAHDLINHFATAFLLAELTQDADAAAMLSPDAVHFAGIVYNAQGY